MSRRVLPFTHELATVVRSAAEICIARGRKLFALNVSLLAATCVLSSCAAPQVNLAEEPREYVATDYEVVLRRWTRSDQLIALSELDDLLTVTATFESWDFRWAYVVRYAHDYRLSVEQRRVLLESTLNETRSHHQFFVALYGTNRRWIDLTKSTSAWIVRLIDDRGNETAPEEIIAITKPGPTERTYFPYASVWRNVYRIKFPVATTTGPTIAREAKMLGLRFAGPQGTEELHWELR
jgi:hypothetical protein